MMDKSIIYTQKKAAKKNRKKDSFYRTFLLILFLFTAFFIIFALVFLIAASINGFVSHPEMSFSYFLFGNEYNPASELFAAGFMIVNTLLVSFFAILIAKKETSKVFTIINPAAKSSEAGLYSFPKRK